MSNKAVRIEPSLLVFIPDRFKTQEIRVMRQCATGHRRCLFLII